MWGVNTDGEKYYFTVNEGEVVIQPGRLFQFMTGGVFQAQLHRAYLSSTPGIYRTMIALGLLPSVDVVCRPPFLDEELVNRKFNPQDV